MESHEYEPVRQPCGDRALALCQLMALPDPPDLPKRRYVVTCGPHRRKALRLWRRSVLMYCRRRVKDR